MPTLPQLTSIITKNYRRIQDDAAERTRRFAAKLGHRRSKSLANTLLIALLFLILPSHQAHALPLLVPLLWAGGAAIGAWIGSKAIEAIGDALMSALVGISWLLFTIAGYFMMAMAGILDLSIQFTINSEIYRSVSAIQVGWTAVRDLANMFFIFVLLFIAIQTILGMGGSNAKRWVAHLVIAALLINFSLFFTQVVVDAGNILAVGFWNKMKVQAGPNASSSAAAFFIEGFKMQTNFDTLKNAASNEKIEIGKVQKIQIYLGGMFVQFVAGYVFLAGAIMMIIRSVTLMVLMIASPFAFLGFALPKGGGFASRWLDRLIGATFLAPAFIFMLYIDSLIIRGTEVLRVTGADQDKFALAFIGSTQNFAVIYNFLLMIILLLASLKVASEVGSGVGASAGSWAKRAIGTGGGFALAGAALASRQTLGRGANALRQNEKIQQAAQRQDLKGSMARMVLRSSNAAAKSGLDLRSTPLAGLARASGVNLGAAGGAGGFTAARTKADKEIIEKAKELFPNNPAAQEAYIRNSTRRLPGMPVDVRMPIAKDSATGKYSMQNPLTVNQKGKEEWQKLGREGIVGGGLPTRLEDKPSQFARKEDKTLKDAKKDIESEANKLRAEESIKKTFEKFEDEAGGLGKEMGEGMKKELEGYFAKIGPKAALEAFPVKDIVKNIKDGKVDRRIDALTPQIMSEMAKDMDKHQESINLLAPKLLAEGSDEQRKYVINQSKNNPAFSDVDLSKELVDRAKRYKEQSAKSAPTDPEARKKHNLELAAHKSAMRDLVGGISPEELARMDNDAVKFDPVIAENYTKAHYEEIGRYHMNDAKDAGTKRAQFDQLREASGRANQGVKDYMKKAVADVNSAYYDPSGDFKSKADAEKKVRDSEGKLRDAERELASFNSDANENFKEGKRGELKKKVEEARAQHESAKKTRDDLNVKKEEPEPEAEEDGDNPSSTVPARPTAN
jgi:hypothetical protein